MGDQLLVRLVWSPSPGQVLLTTPVLTGYMVDNQQVPDGVQLRLTALELMSMVRVTMVSVPPPVLRMSHLSHSASETMSTVVMPSTLVTARRHQNNQII